MAAETSSQPDPQAYQVSRELLAKYAKPGPRYTSYPTAPVWSPDFGPEQARSLYRKNNAADPGPLALYVHLPYCSSLCWYCGCHVKISRNKQVVEPYLQALDKELELVSAYWSPERQISQMHWGGGTPTYLSPGQIEQLVEMVESRVAFAPGAELSIEVDPRVTTLEHLQALRRCGFNRLSMGVQDFNSQVQEAVHRVQGFAATRSLIENARRLGFTSINIDLMYGLPYQSVDSFQETLYQVDALDPDRLALFNYAHVPWLKPAQKLIKPETLPDPESKLQIFELAIAHLLQRGYRYIGMDHFAKPTDELALAQQAHTLRRNFMGYTTQAGTDLYGFGVSSISEIDGHFVQNEKDIPSYEQLLTQEQLPSVRGMWLSFDDHVRKDIIEQLICNGYLDFGRLQRQYGLDLEQRFAPELAASQQLADDGLIQLDAAGITVLPPGQILIRNVCMIWDAYLQTENPSQRFSQTV